MQNILSIAHRFRIDSEIASIRPHGNGNVNDTYLVTFAQNRGHAVLQRVNTYVFKQPETVMYNMRKATRHLMRCVEEDGLAWQVQQVIVTDSGTPYWQSPQEGFWRMVSYIENAESFDTVYTHEQAHELGYALGMFHAHINRLSVSSFEPVIEGFHQTPRYLDAYDRARSAGANRMDEELSFASEMIETYRKDAARLEDAKQKGILPLRTIHGDPKANNIMFDKRSGKAVSMIDLDTIQPGLVHYDIGDCIRSVCNPLGEEPGLGWRDTTFDSESFEHLMQGYQVWGSGLLSPEEYTYIYDAIFLMAFELGLRFLTDYLEGDRYYKIHFPSQNKYRALTQFKLAEQIAKQQNRIKKVVEKLALSRNMQ